jgi:hypothetical protein
MAKKPEKKIIPKKEFNLDDFMKNEGLDSSITEKELKWIPLSPAFHDAVKVPGIPMGYFVSFRGYSNTGKSTAIYEAIVGCQKLGVLAVVFETEGNWNWEHAKKIGVELREEVDTETGELRYKPKDFMLLQGPDLVNLYQSYDHQHSKMGTKPLRYEPVVEDISYFMHNILDKQQDGTIQQDVAFFWDSVGSINCFKGATSKTTNNQWTAGALATCFKSLINYRIPSSRRTDSPYSATFAVVQQIWLDNENKVIKHKGGEAFFYSPRMIFHFGGILTHSTEKLKATFQGEEYQFGVLTKIRCEKNQVNGIEQKGTIASTPHGYWNPDKIDEYKTQHKDFIKEMLNTEYDDFIIETESVGFSAEDMSS